MTGLFAREGAEFVVNTTTFDDQRRPTVVKLANGNFVVVWDDISRAASGPDDIESVRGQLFSSAGQPIGTEFLVNTFTYNNQVDSHVAPLANGGFVVSWTDYSYQGGDSDKSAVKAQIFDAAGARVGGEILVNTTIAGYQMQPATSGLPDGGFVAVWADLQNLLSLGGDIHAQRFDAAGNKVGPEFQVNSMASPRQGSPAVATLADGRFIVTWTDGSAGTTDGSGSSVRGQLYRVDGTPIGGEFQVTEHAYGSQTNQTVTALAGGGFLAVWADQMGFPGSELFEAGGSALEAQIFDAAGNRVGGEFLINPIRRTNSSGATVAAMPDGTFVVSWNDFSYRDNDEVWSHVAAQAFDPLGNRLGDQFYLETTRTVNDQTALAALDGGRFVAVWHGGAGDAWHNNYPGDIKMQIFVPARGIVDIELSNAALSETQPNNLKIGTITPLSEAVNARVTYQIVSDSTGGGFRIEGNRIVVADNSRLDYEAGATVTLTVRAFDGTGGYHDEIVRLTLVDAAVERRWTASEEAQVNTIISWDQVDPAVASRGGGGYVVVWEDPNSGGDRYGPSIKAQLHDALGARVGGEFLVNSPMGAQQVDPAVSRLADGGFVVAWTELGLPGEAQGSSVKAKQFDAAGRAVAGEFGEFFLQADPGQAGEQQNVALAGLASGGFAAAWYDSAGDASGGGIKARLFSPSGAPASGELLVNSATGGEQVAPAIAALAAGGFVVTWTDSSDGSGTGIKAQRFDSAGNAVGGEILVNTTTAGDQSGSDVAGLAGGGFVVAWQQGSIGIRAQAFDASGAKVGAEFEMNALGWGPSVTALADGGFVIAAMGDGTAGIDGVGVVAQQYDHSGNRIGSQWVVNETQTGNQRAPSLATLDSGGLAFAWMEPSDSPASDRNGGSIRGRVFLPPAETPRAFDDSFKTDEATAIAGSVLADNGAGVDIGGGRVVAVNGSSAAVGQEVRLSSGALLTLNGDGSFTYKPNGAFAPLVDPESGAANGTARDSFTYTLEGGSTATASVQVTGITEPGEPLIGSAGDDRISGGDGNNLFRLNQAGIDYAYGDAGDDIFYFGAAMNWLDQVGGGSGLDTVALQGNYQTHFGTGSFFGIETLLLLSSGDGRFGAAAADAAARYSYKLSLISGAVYNGQMLTIDARGLAAGETLSLDASGVGSSTTSDGTGQLTMFGGQGNDSLTGSALVDQIHGGGGDDYLSGGERADTMVGGAGNDVYVVDGTDSILELAGEGIDEVRTTVESYVLPEHFENLTGFHGTAQRLTGNGGDNRIQGSTGNDVLDGGAGADVLTGAGGNDFLLLQGGGDDSAAAGADNDALYFGAAYTAADTVDGGTGRDQMALQGDYALALGPVTGIEDLILLSGTDTRFGDPGTNLYSYAISSTDSNVAAGQRLLVDGTQLVAGERFTFDGSAERDGSFVLSGGDGIDTLTGGAGSDGFYFRHGTFWGPNDKVTGGANDQIGFRGDFTGANKVVMGADQISGVVTLVMMSGTDIRFGAGVAPTRFDIQMHDGNVGAGQRFTIDGSFLGSDETMRIDGALETNGFFRMFGGSGADILIGGAGNDLLRGNGGGDQLTGNGGADRFVYGSASESTSLGFDLLSDLKSAEDLLDLHSAVTGWSASVGSGQLSQSSFDSDLAAALDGALDPGKAILFDPNSGTYSGRHFLIVDANGDGAYTAGADYVFELGAGAAIDTGGAGFFV